ncbi:MAG TPA: hypothetical protein VGE07_17480 [Herpetosiphonaceae bacterium]
MDPTIRRRAYELICSLLLGDAITTLVEPERHMRLWRDALPWRWWHAVSDWFIARPAATRLYGLAQAAAALAALPRAYRRD